MHRTTISGLLICVSKLRARFLVWHKNPSVLCTFWGGEHHPHKSVILTPSFTFSKLRRGFSCAPCTHPILCSFAFKEIPAQKRHSDALICDKQTAGPLSCLAQKSLRSMHFLGGEHHPHKSVTLTPSFAISKLRSPLLYLAKIPSTICAFYVDRRPSTVDRQPSTVYRLWSNVQRLTSIVAGLLGKPENFYRVYRVIRAVRVVREISYNSYNSYNSYLG